MKTFKDHRFSKNPLEEKIVKKFIERHGDRDISMIVFPPSNSSGMYPSEYLTDREEDIVVSTMQWLGSSVGQYFLSECGFKLEKNEK